jgi:hypothetical protein
MKKVIRYISRDGTEFNTKSACIKQEEADDAFLQAMLPLGPDPKLRYGTYRQHDKKIVQEVMLSVLEVVVEYYPEFSQWIVPAHENLFHCMMGRALSESDAPKSCWRMARISLATGREYDQAYFTSHENEATEEAQ